MPELRVVKDVRAFYRGCGHKLGDVSMYDVETLSLLLGLVVEEFCEVMGIEGYIEDWLKDMAGRRIQQLAHNDADLSVFCEIADGLLDLTYVSVGFLDRVGFDTTTGWSAVQRTNMAKIDPTTGEVRRREDGKILKPEGWEGPDEVILQLVKNVYHRNNEMPTDSIEEQAHE